MRRRLLTIILGASLGLAIALPAAAHTTVDINPSSQSRDSGELASWTVSWNGSGSTRVVFCPGGGSDCKDRTTSGNSRGFTHTFYECTNKTIEQTAYVTQGGHALGKYAYTSVSAGRLC